MSRREKSREGFESAEESKQRRARVVLEKGRQGVKT